MNLLRQIEVAVANGKSTSSLPGRRHCGADVLPLANEYGGWQGVVVGRLKELEQENGKLKRLVSELSLEKLVLKDIASGNF